MRHWGPHNPNGAECRFCSNPPFPHIRNSQDAADHAACFEARWPPLYTRLRGIVSQLERAARAVD